MFRLCDATLLTAVINMRVLILGMRILSSFSFLAKATNRQEPALPGTRSADTRTIRLSRLKIGRRPTSPLNDLPSPSRSSRHRCHLQRGISIFSIRSNLIDAVHRAPAFARRINNVAVHNTRAMTASGNAAIETRYETRRLHISESCRDVETML